MCKTLGYKKGLYWLSSSRLSWSFRLDEHWHKWNTASSSDKPLSVAVLCKIIKKVTVSETGASSHHSLKVSSYESSLPNNTSFCELCRPFRLSSTRQSLFTNLCITVVFQSMLFWQRKGKCGLRQLLTFWLRTVWPPSIEHCFTDVFVRLCCTLSTWYPKMLICENTLHKQLQRQKRSISYIEDWFRVEYTFLTAWQCQEQTLRASFLSAHT